MPNETINISHLNVIIIIGKTVYYRSLHKIREISFCHEREHLFAGAVCCLQVSNRAIDGIAKMHSAYLDVGYDITFLTNSNCSSVD